MVELLAPAGNPESLKGALNAGADAVYLGGNRFGARAFADNFTDEELMNGLRYAHLLGKKIYLTVNTLIKQEELDEVYRYLKPFYESGLDGVIVQDIGIFSCIRRWFPDMELHASTQMTITGEYGAELIKELGAVRIVPARELCLNEIRAIKQKTGLQMETFIHGAMCYSYSGQCLFSSMLGERSGNRGRCAQPCRLGYQMKVDGQTSKVCYPLSMKDMCTVELIPEFVRAGIDSFKIEGRMKKAEYVAGVTAVYRKYIDRFYADEKADRLSVEEKDRKILSSLYIRTGVQEGYYHRHNGTEMITLDSPAYHSNDEELLLDIRKQYLSGIKKLPVKISASFLTGQPAVMEMQLLEDEEIGGRCDSDPVLKAQKNPVGEEELIQRLSKLGDTFFEAVKAEVQVSKDAFYPVGMINTLRRNTCKALEEAILSKSTKEKRISNLPGDFLFKAKEGMPGEHVVSVSVRELFQLEKTAEYSFYRRIYIDGDLFKREFDRLQSVLENFYIRKTEVIIALPYILRKRDEKYLDELYRLILKAKDRVAGIQVRSLEAMGFLIKKDYCGNIYTDAGFYVWNTESMKVFSGRVKRFCLPFELTFREQKEIAPKYPCEKVIYGRIPMMISANCIAKTCGNCTGKTDRKVFLTDRYRKDFPVLLNCEHCMNVIYNSVPLSLHAKASEFLNLCDVRLDFTMESLEECKRVMEFFERILSGKCTEIAPPCQEFTTGHERRSVE